MKLEEHEKQSVEWFGKPWTEVHVFLDQFKPLFRGPEHRRILHHTAGVNEVVRRFGEEAREVAELHIKEDWRFYCGVWDVPTLKELTEDDWLLLRHTDKLHQDEIMKELFTEKLDGR